jgi:hypothetical protein
MSRTSRARDLSAVCEFRPAPVASASRLAQVWCRIGYARLNRPRRCPGLWSGIIRQFVACKPRRGSRDPLRMVMRRLGAQLAVGSGPHQTSAKRYRGAIPILITKTSTDRQLPPSAHGPLQQSFRLCKICMGNARVTVRRSGKNGRLFVRRTISFRRRMTFAMLLSCEKNLSPSAVERGTAS